MPLHVFFFFFSSRRRHTRLQGDWSSDVCSSDLGNELRFGLSEYDYAGGHRGEPFEVIESELYGLPLPAHAEIVLEGEMIPGDVAPEGPFGEFTGYYAGGKSEQPVIRVRRIYHRNEPILTMATPMRPPSDFSYSKCVMKAGMIWDEVERAGLSGVKGVWGHEAGGARMFNVISIKQPTPAMRSRRRCSPQAASPAPTSAASGWSSTTPSTR